MAGHSSYTSGRCHTGHRHGLSHVLTARAPLHTMGIAERVRFRGTFRGLRWVSRERGFEELSGVLLDLTASLLLMFSNKKTNESSRRKKRECVQKEESVCDALRCSGPHEHYTDVFNESIALADRPE
ncbi:hypothetical protein JHK84_047900 [Glycine max]|nr:hypothetical protein JHK85_048489 [Glycine max]KAG5102931.1 hypothetical protein JHK84_047900 [Glycine max]